MIIYLEPDLNPPEEEECTAMASYFEYIQFRFDIEIQIDEDGSWEYSDQDYNFAKNLDESSGTWYGETIAVKLADHVEVVEYLDELLLDYLLAQPKGTYKMSGVVELVFTVEGVEFSNEYKGMDEDGDPIIDTEYYTDGVEVKFNKLESSIENLTLIKI